MEWPLHAGSNWARSSSTASGSQSYGYTQINAGSANTKTAWSEMISAANNVHGFASLLIVPGTAHGSVRMTLDIGIGSSGSEQVLVPDVFWQHNNYALPAIILPIHVPAGQRIAARMQAHTTPGYARPYIAGLATPFLPGPPCHRVQTYGVTTSSDTNAVDVDAGGTAHTKGSWAEITSGTTGPVKQLVLLLSRYVASTQTAADWSVDVGVGGSGSEQVLLPDLWVGAGGSADVRPMCWGPFPVDLPEGTRIAVRAQCSINTANHRVLKASVLALD